MQNKITCIVMSALMILLSAFTAEARTRLRPQKIKKLSDATQKEAVDNRDYFEESFPRDDEIKREERSSGSLWVDSYASRMYNNLHRAANVGDMVTILVEEASQGTKTAETKLDRRSNHVFGEAGLFGLFGKVTGSVTGFDPSNALNARHEARHNGKGETKRKETMNAALTARVVRVLKNGDMQIRGQKNIKLNGEEQVLVLEGFIRPYDINPDNTIMSTFIADARITMNGFGVVADQQKPGWLTRFLHKVLPF